MKFYLGYIFLIITTSIVSTGYGYPQLPDSMKAKTEVQTEVDNDMLMEPNEQNEQQSAQQAFYPSFSSPFHDPPLGHSRPIYFNNQQEGAYSQRQNNGFNQQQIFPFESPRYSGFKDNAGYASQQNGDKLGLLGSGNFGVIKGGTYYGKDTEKESSSNYDADYDYFGNGHGGPSSYFGGGRGVPNPKPYKHEQFANFKDFADINSPANTAYSEFVVVYVNKNDTKEKLTNRRPKNIIESLALLDTEAATTEEAPIKKLSKSKRKLAKTIPEKKHLQKLKAKSENNEPLLALS